MFNELAKFRCGSRCELFGIDDALIGGAISGLGSLATNLFNKSNVKDQQQFMAQQAQQQEAFQMEMSNTAWQRGVADMKAAGINPILAYQKGPASSPTGAMAGTPAIPGVQNSLADAVSSAQQIKHVNEQVDLLREQVLNTAADSHLKTSQIKVQDATEDLVKSETDRTKAEATTKNILIQSAIAEAAKSKTDADFFSSPAGRVLRLLGLGGQQLNSAIAPVTSAVGAAKGASQIINNRWP